jgi:hypothetical protein
MNERIEALDDEAQEYAGSIAGNDEDSNYVAWFNIYKEKFAELIVKECVKSTLSLRDTAIDNEWNLDETFHMIVDTIVQHIFRS